MSQVNQQEEMTAEQLAEYQQHLKDFYTNGIKHLTIAKEYHTLKADIEIAKLRELQAKIQIASIQSPNTEEDASTTENE